MKKKYLYLNTIGCQMNVYDSERIAAGLRALGYAAAPMPEMADLVIVNTCSIREKASQKAFSFLGRLAALKKEKPGLIVGAGGCVAQQEGDRIFDRMPHIDFVFGTEAIGRLSGMIRRLEAGERHLLDIEMSQTPEPEAPFALKGERNGPTAFVTVMRGCDNYCAYCVVPHVRGREISRSPEAILEEIRIRVGAGVKEVTLLGQNVNSYGIKERLCTFPELLSKIDEIPGLERIRFTTSHPKDLSEGLIRAFRELPRLCRHIHLPVQSGSNLILARMNRKYDRDLYLEKVARLRKACPDIAITSDIIVGFPGETEPDFEQTLDLVEEIEFDGLFTFMYSDRPNVASAGFTGKVAEKEKRRRLEILQEFQETFTLRKTAALIGSIQSILVEGLSRKKGDATLPEARRGTQWTGRTTTNRVVNFVSGDPDPGDFTGRMVRVRIANALPHSLWGEPIEGKASAVDRKEKRLCCTR